MNPNATKSPMRNTVDLQFAADARDRSGNRSALASIGAGATGRAIALQLGTPVPGCGLAGIVESHAGARRARVPRGRHRDMGNGRHAERGGCAHRARHACAHRRSAPCSRACDAIDLIVEVTGTVDFGASVVLDAFEHGKPVVLVNAELDSLLGPILKAKADEAGVVLTHTDGDEPGVAMTLFRYVQSVGLRPVAAGNIKGMVDYYRTPDTQQAFAAKNDQDVRKVTSFADATKLSMETTVLPMPRALASAAAACTAPLAATCASSPSCCRRTRCSSAGSSTTRVGAAPHTGGFVVVHEENPHKKTQLAYYKLGDGPFYVFYTPFHLPHIQLPSTIARAVLHPDPTVTPLAGPSCEVVTVAKRDFKSGRAARWRRRVLQLRPDREPCDRAGD